MTLNECELTWQIQAINRSELWTLITLLMKENTCFLVMGGEYIVRTTERGRDALWDYLYGNTYIPPGNARLKKLTEEVLEWEKEQRS
jgi:hypothetical protein